MKLLEIKDFPYQAELHVIQEPDFYISRIVINKPKDYQHKKLKSDHYQGICITSGNANIYLKNKISLSKGDLLIINPEIIAYLEGSFACIVFEFRGMKCEKNLKDFLPENRVHFPDAGKLISKDLDTMFSSFSNNQGSIPASACLAWKILETVQQQPYETDIAQLSKKMLETDYAKGVSINEIADKLNINRSTLYRRFKEVHGISPKQFLNQKKIAKGRELILTTLLPVKVIASQSGFESIQQFYHMYKKTFNESPTQLRKALGRSN